MTPTGAWLCCKFCEPIFKTFWFGITENDLLVGPGARWACAAVPEAITCTVAVPVIGKPLLVPGRGWWISDCMWVIFASITLTCSLERFIPDAGDDDGALFDDAIGEKILDPLLGIEICKEQD